MSRRLPAAAVHPNPRTPASRRAAFTLVELLVVTAIIAVLASMLLPAMAGARRRARSVRCLSNLRELGRGVVLYADDNADHLPFAWYDNPDPRENSFYALLSPALLGAAFDGYSDFESRVFLCPSRPGEPLAKGHPIRVSYGMNASNAVEFPAPATRRMSSVQSVAPASTLLAADVQHAYNHPPIRTLSGTEVGYRHDRRANVAFFDGHAASAAESETNRITLGPRNDP